MKILVLSDSHKNTDSVLDAIFLESPDLILHLGDNSKDCDAIEDEFPEITLRSVRGNCDYGFTGLPYDEFKLEGKNFFMTHGHNFSVKTGLTGLIRTAVERNVDVLLFGHTHIQHYSVVDGIMVINPGSIGLGKSYAVLDLENGEVSCELKTL